MLRIFAAVVAWEVRNTRRDLTYRKILNKAQLTLMKESIVPVSIPILKEDAIKLIIHTTVRGTEVDGHIAGRVRVDIEAVHFTSLDRDLAVCRVNFAVLAVDLDAHDTRLDAEIFGLKLMKMQERAFGTHRGLDQPLQIFRDLSIPQVMFIGLAEEKAAARWRLKELGSQKTAEPIMVSKWFFPARTSYART